MGIYKDADSSINKSINKSTNMHKTINTPDDFLQLRPLSDLAHSSKWGNLVRKRWKQLVLKGNIDVLVYPNPRTCNFKACDEVLVNPLESFIHIRMKHLPKNK